MNEDYFGKYEWDGKTILVVEDDISSSFFLKEVLADTHADILFAADGSEAIDMCSRHSEIDLVLMDIQLPEVDGYTATREIKKNRPSLPVIAQTAYAFQSDRKKCFEAGCSDYIAKPINADLLLEKISALMDGSDEKGKEEKESSNL